MVKNNEKVITKPLHKFPLQISTIVAMDIELFFFLVAILFATWRIPQRPQPAMASFSSGGGSNIGSIGEP